MGIYRVIAPFQSTFVGTSLGQEINDSFLVHFPLTVSEYIQRGYIEPIAGEIPAPVEEIKDPVSPEIEAAELVEYHA